MGIAALTRAADGSLVVPTSDAEWDDWVSASATRNHVLDDPLLDWLERHGEARGFRPGDVDAFDERTDFLTFIFRKGAEFETAVVDHLRTLVDVTTILSGGTARVARRDLAVAEATFEAVRAGAPVIHQGVLRDAETRTYGLPDLLVRSDVLRQLFPTALTTEAATIGAPDLGLADHHYRVVDIKFATLHLLAGGELDNTGSSPAYKVQVFIYNRALGRLQGYLPPEAFLLGRGWEQTRHGETVRVTNSMDRLAPVANDYASRASGSVASHADAAVQWLRRMRRDGHAWQPLPEPTVEELRPNATGDPGRWSDALKQILREGQDLTQLWYVGVDKRRAANARGLTRWTDPRVTPAAVGVNGPATAPKLQALLDVNRSADGPPVRPAQIAAARGDWYDTPALEFYVDFETVSELDDDFTRIPEHGGQNLIFMIGCGHIEDGIWRYECFTADRLREPPEAVIIDRWFEHMAAVQARLAPHAASHVLHWSHHEVSWLEEAFYAAVRRHPEKDWPHPHWFDFLMRVVREEPVVVRGAHGFGLKPVTNAMHALGLVETRWSEGPADGLGAMVGAWWCEHDAESAGGRLADIGLMQDIEAYNEVDCKAMMEIVRYLRSSH